MDSHRKDCVRIICSCTQTEWVWRGKLIVSVVTHRHSIDNRDYVVSIIYGHSWSLWESCKCYE